MTLVKPINYIIGIDPGDSMGICALKLHDSRVERIHFQQGTVSSAVNWLEETLYGLSKSSAGALIACERFTVTPETGKRSQQPTALQAIGSVKLLAERFETRLVMFPPADAKAIGTNEMLKRLGLHVTAKQVDCPDANDANDAARHAVLALARFKASIFDAMLTAKGV